MGGEENHGREEEGDDESSEGERGSVRVTHMKKSKGRGYNEKQPKQRENSDMSHDQSEDDEGANGSYQAPSLDLRLVKLPGPPPRRDYTPERRGK